MFIKNEWIIIKCSETNIATMIKGFNDNCNDDDDDNDNNGDGDGDGDDYGEILWIEMYVFTTENRTNAVNDAICRILCPINYF